ncbi:hypothetical protein [Pseudodesulfovibrio pelocollis]|uniref:hypothetical protein n=1 Tax=Pseudodesulfovibrio pelocollis TaxID=3051432 RepID=UPI00255A8DAE|nr:hypothetical protein [Pseudodesulfovibrio sp. SB368]
MSKFIKKCSTCENNGCWACDTKLTDEEVIACLFYSPNKRSELEAVELNLKFGRLARPRYRRKLLERAKALRVGKIESIADAIEVLELKVA